MSGRSGTMDPCPPPMRCPASRHPPASGSPVPSRRRPPHRSAPGSRSPTVTTPWSSRRRGRARRCPPSCGPSTVWPARTRTRPPAHESPLHLPTQGARRRRRAQSAHAADRDFRRSHRRRHRPSGGHRRRAVRRHSRRRAPSTRPHPTGHPDHHSRVAVSDAHLGGSRNTGRRCETVIVDEVHAVAGTKRGTHLALSLERLDSMLADPAQRIGLSATVRPPEEVAAFLGGSRP